MEFGYVIVILGAACIGLILWVATHESSLSRLPSIYYVLAILCGIVLLGFTAANKDNLNSTEIGSWIGYSVGAVLSMFAVGRVIELLQQIRDAVRNTPALSPGRPEDE